MQSIGSLAREADLFHRVLLQEPMPLGIRARYVEAHQYVFPANELSSRAQEIETIQRVLDQRLDVEAVEMALRRKSPRHLLTQKIHIFLYLVESEPRYYSRFYNDERKRVRSYLILGLLVLQSAFTLLRGMLLIWRYRLA